MAEYEKNRWNNNIIHEVACGAAFWPETSLSLCLADRFPFHVRLSPAAIELLSIRRESSCHKRMQEKVKKAHSTKSKKKIQIINKEMLLPAGAREMLLLLATLGSEGSHKNCTS